MSAPPSPAPFSTHLIRWTKHTENEFLRLAKAEALGRISDEDMVRLETYSAQRARLKSPRSAEEVLAEYRRARVVDQLTKALDAYAKEFGTPAG